MSHGRIDSEQAISTKMKGKEKQLASALAQYVKDYDLDGVDVDFEDKMTEAAIEWLIGRHFFHRGTMESMLTATFKRFKKSSGLSFLLHVILSVTHLRLPGLIQRTGGPGDTRQW